MKMLYFKGYPRKPGIGDTYDSRECTFITSMPAPLKMREWDINRVWFKPISAIVYDSLLSFNIKAIKMEDIPGVTKL